MEAQTIQPRGSHANLSLALAFAIGATCLFAATSTPAQVAEIEEATLDESRGVTVKYRSGADFFYYILWRSEDLSKLGVAVDRDQPAPFTLSELHDNVALIKRAFYRITSHRLEMPGSAPVSEPANESPASDSKPEDEIDADYDDSASSTIDTDPNTSGNPNGFRIGGSVEAGFQYRGFYYVGIGDMGAGGVLSELPWFAEFAVESSTGKLTGVDFNITNQTFSHPGLGYSIDRETGRPNFFRKEIPGDGNDQFPATWPALFAHDWPCDENSTTILVNGQGQAVANASEAVYLLDCSSGLLSRLAADGTALPTEYYVSNTGVPMLDTVDPFKPPSEFIATWPVKFGSKEMPYSKSPVTFYLDADGNVAENYYVPKYGRVKNEGNVTGKVEEIERVSGYSTDYLIHAASTLLDPLPNLAAPPNLLLGPLDVGFYSDRLALTSWPADTNANPVAFKPQFSRVEDLVGARQEGSGLESAGDPPPILPDPDAYARANSRRVYVATYGTGTDPNNFGTGSRVIEFPLVDGSPTLTLLSKDSNPTSARVLTSRTNPRRDLRDPLFAGDYSGVTIPQDGSNLDDALGDRDLLALQDLNASNSNDFGVITVPPKGSSGVQVIDSRLLTDDLAVEADYVGIEGARAQTGTFRITSASGNLVEGLTNYWNFDGNLNDSAHGIPGSASTVADNGVFDGANGTDGIEYGNGLFGGAGLKQNGASADNQNDGFVRVSHSPDTFFAQDAATGKSGSLTISVWVKAAGFDTNWQTILSHGEGNQYRIARARLTHHAAYAGGTNDVPSPTTLAPTIGRDNGWHHIVAITEAGVSTRIWIDGDYITESGAPGQNGGAPTIDNQGDHSFAELPDLFIGANPQSEIARNQNREWLGEIDDVAQWGRVLDDDEIRQLFVAGKAGQSLGDVLQDQVVTTGFGAAIARDGTFPWVRQSKEEPEPPGTLSANHPSGLRAAPDGDPIHVSGASLSSHSLEFVTPGLDLSESALTSTAAPPNDRVTEQMHMSDPRDRSLGYVRLVCPDALVSLRASEITAALDLTIRAETTSIKDGGSYRATNGSLIMRSKDVCIQGIERLHAAKKVWLYGAADRAASRLEIGAEPSGVPEEPQSHGAAISTALGPGGTIRLDNFSSFEIAQTTLSTRDVRIRAIGAADEGLSILDGVEIFSSGTARIFANHDLEIRSDVTVHNGQVAALTLSIAAGATLTLIGPDAEVFAHTHNYGRPGFGTLIIKEDENDVGVMIIGSSQPPSFQFRPPFDDA